MAKRRLRLAVRPLNAIAAGWHATAGRSVRKRSGRSTSQSAVHLLKVGMCEVCSGHEDIELRKALVGIRISGLTHEVVGIQGRVVKNSRDARTESYFFKANQILRSHVRWSVYACKSSNHSHGIVASLDYITSSSVSPPRSPTIPPSLQTQPRSVLAQARTKG